MYRSLPPSSPGRPSSPSSPGSLGSLGSPGSPGTACRPMPLERLPFPSTTGPPHRLAARGADLEESSGFLMTRGTPPEPGRSLPGSGWGLLGAADLRVSGWLWREVAGPGAEKVDPRLLCARAGIGSWNQRIGPVSPAGLSPPSYCPAGASRLWRVLEISSGYERVWRLCSGGETSLVMGKTSESLARSLLICDDLRRHRMAAAAARAMSKTTERTPPTTMPTRSAELGSSLAPELASAAPFVMGVMLTAAPVGPLDVAGGLSVPPATFVDPADKDGGGREAENVDAWGGMATDDGLAMLVGAAALVGGVVAAGVGSFPVGSAAEGGDVLDGGGTTVKVVGVVGDVLDGGDTTVKVVRVVGGGSTTTVEVDASGVGAVEAEALCQLSTARVISSPPSKLVGCSTH
jgi:hypothetical protein